MKQQGAFPAVTEILPDIAELVTSAARSCGMLDAHMAQLELAVDEACTNIINYAYAGTDGGKIEILCEDDREDFLVTIRDNGAPFDQTEPTEPDLDSPIEERHIGGLGRFFMKKCVDELTYRREDNCNSLTFRKKIR